MKNLMIFENIYNKFIEPLLIECSKKMGSIHKEIFSRMRKLTFKDVFLTECLVNGSKKSYDLVISQNIVDNIYDFTKKSILTKRTKINSSYSLQIIDCILDIICKENKENNEYRYLAVDGTFTYVPILTKEKNLTLCNNKQCNILLVSAIFELEKKIPINYEVYGHKNERKAITSQLKYLKQNDVLIFDRGYYSNQLLLDIKKNNLNAIFRLPKGLKLVKQLKKSLKDELIINVKVNNTTIPLKLISYKLNEGKGDENYYLASTLIDDKSIDFYKDIYHKRWEIETHFKHVKYNQTLANIKSKTLDGIKKDVFANQFVCIISGYIEYLLTNHIQRSKNKYKINTNNCLNLTNTTLLPLLFYKRNEKSTIETVKSTFNTITKTLVCIKKNRHYKRIRKRPMGKWRNSGGTSGRPRTKGCLKRTIQKKCSDPDVHITNNK